MYQITDKRRFAVFLAVILAVVAAGGFLIFRQMRKNANDPDKPTLAQAAEIGEKKTFQLLVQIWTPKEASAGQYERGDIIMTAPADKEWSDAEKEGFLILKMELTDKQAELLVRSLEKESGQPAPEGEPAPKETVKARRYAVDLAKIGIASDQQKGKILEDKVFGWDIVLEK